MITPRSKPIFVLLALIPGLFLLAFAASFLFSPTMDDGIDSLPASNPFKQLVASKIESSSSFGATRDYKVRFVKVSSAVVPNDCAPGEVLKLAPNTQPICTSSYYEGEDWQIRIDSYWLPGVRYKTTDLFQSQAHSWHPWNSFDSGAE